MKGLYCRAAGTDAEPGFVIQHTSLPEVLGSHLVRVQVKACGLSPLDFKLLDDLGIQRDLLPVGREVAGVVLQVGDKVSFFQPEDEVVVQKPEKLSSVCVAGALRDGLRAHTALHTHARMAAGHTLLVMDGASSFGLMCIQLACYHGVKVLTTSHSPQKHAFLEQLRPSVGVQDPLVVRLCEEESEKTKLLPHKHDIISVLGVGGHWVTSHKDLQLDPPDCRFLYLKSASMTFLNHEVWTASSAQQGRYLRILCTPHLVRYSEGHRGEDVSRRSQVTRHTTANQQGRRVRHVQILVSDKLSLSNDN
ncbi:hypothetical protein FQN60_014660 [Etheostoma spectabile]|uniref:Enoyl reductase (ER) domain-containing protein n=1 Tax=Etheostoma spectabile TaxID=54343 RepID=A0A5J5CNE1_9PERO|nr:hypothetical protein FQN60_014660 [Etheostoma spectabile]